MNVPARRRLAAVSIATLTAAATVLLLVSPASAGAITKVSPPFGLNNNPSQTLTLTTESLFAPSSMVELARVGAAGTSPVGESIVGFTDNAVPSRTPTVTLDLTDEGDGFDDGPANPGTYNVTITNGPVDPFTRVTSPTATVDSCQSCFRVFPSTTLSLKSASPNGLSQGGSGVVEFTGTGFARGTRIEVLLPGGGVDTKITANGVPFTHHGDDPEGQQACAADFQPAPCDVEVRSRTTSTTLVRDVKVAPEAPLGTRDVRVTNTDGDSAVCVGCFTVNGAPLQSISPNVERNDSDTATVRIAFRGSNLPVGGTPQLVFVGSNPGSASKPDLTVRGSVVSHSATVVETAFDLRDAAPGTEAYQPQLVAPNGSVSTCTCRFSIVQLTKPSITSVDPDGASQSDSRTVTIKGNYLSRGLRVTFGDGVTVTSVTYVSRTEAQAQLQVSGTAPLGKRDVTPQTADGQVGGACTGCFTIRPRGSSSPSPSESADPSGGGGFVPMSSPVRVFDSRTTSSPLREGPTTLDLSSRLPAGASSAVLNVTALNATNRGHVVIYPAGTTRPTTSNVNFRKAGNGSAAAQANEAITRLSPDRRVVVEVASGTSPAARAQLVVDLVGYFTSTAAGSGGRLQALTPQRVFDSASSSQPRRSGETIVDLSSRAGTATAAVLNVTIQGPSEPGFAVVYPTGTNRPETSNVNFDRGQTQANEVITRIGANGRVSVFLGGRVPPSARVVVDLVGLIGAQPTASYHPLSRAVRALDTRDPNNSGGSAAGRRNGPVRITLPTSVPAGASAVILNVTTTSASGPGHVTAYPTGTAHPGTSNVNFVVGADQANQVIVGVGSDRQVTLDISGRNAPVTHVIADVAGYLAVSSSSPSPSTTASGSATPSASGGATPTGSPTATPTATASATPSCLLCQP